MPMGSNRYTSEIKHISQNQDIVFNYLSNFEHLSAYINESLLEKINGQIPQVKISDFEADKDSCRFSISGMGQAEIRIIEREPSKTIKIASSGNLPLQLVMWIQLLPVSTYETKMRLTLDAEMSMMIKMMVSKKLEDGVNQLADMISKLPFK